MRSKLAIIVLSLPTLVAAAPFTPQSDTEILERVPLRASDRRSIELSLLRTRLAADPRNEALVATAVRRYHALASELGDARFMGYAESLLAPWRQADDPPAAILLARSRIRQYRHEFGAAHADLAQAVAKDGGNAEAWSWKAAVEMVLARYDDARHSCERMRALAPALIVDACVAQADALTGRLHAAYTAVQRTYAAAAATATPAHKLWVLTLMAELAERLGDDPAAEQHFRAAAALGLTDPYLLARYADFLLDQGRHGESIRLLQPHARVDTLLLRLALAQKSIDAAAHRSNAAALAARYNAARRRGESVHAGDESRFTLEVRADAPSALKLAIENWGNQREPIDARFVLEAALAARDPQAARPVLDWMERHRIEHRTLERLAVRLRDAGAR